jgi:hypothetical protein
VNGAPLRGSVTALRREVASLQSCQERASTAVGGRSEGAQGVTGASTLSWATPVSVGPRCEQERLCKAVVVGS